jgi:hypothetical protein
MPRSGSPHRPRNTSHQDDQAPRQRLGSIPACSPSCVTEGNSMNSANSQAPATATTTASMRPPAHSSTAITGEGLPVFGASVVPVTTVMLRGFVLPGRRPARTRAGVPGVSAGSPRHCVRGLRGVGWPRLTRGRTQNQALFAQVKAKREDLTSGFTLLDLGSVDRVGIREWTVMTTSMSQGGRLTGHHDSH